MSTEAPEEDDVFDAIDDAQVETLTGDVRDLILVEMRNSKDKPWSDRGEDEQRDMIDRVERFAESIVRRVVNLVATAGRLSVPVIVKEWKVGDDLKIALTGAASSANIDALVEGRSAAKFLVFGDIEDFRGERAAVVAKPDQPELALEHDEDGVVIEDDEPVFDVTPAGQAA